MNKIQRIILAIFIPIIILFITLTIANSVGVTCLTTVEILSEDDPFYELLGEVSSSTSYTNDPFDWEKTWYVWLLSLVFCCFFEYKLFADKKRKEK
jgi:hypothetical protein